MSGCVVGFLPAFETHWEGFGVGGLVWYWCLFALGADEEVFACLENAIAGYVAAKGLWSGGVPGACVVLWL